MSAEACWLEGDNQCHLTLQRYTKGECHQIQSPPLKKNTDFKMQKKSVCGSKTASRLWRERD